MYTVHTHTHTGKTSRKNILSAKQSTVESSRDENRPTEIGQKKKNYRSIDTLRTYRTRITRQYDMNVLVLWWDDGHAEEKKWMSDMTHK